MQVISDENVGPEKLIIIVTVIEHCLNLSTTISNCGTSFCGELSYCARDGRRNTVTNNE